MKRPIITILFLAFTYSLFATVQNKQLQLRIESQYGSYDQTIIYFDYGVTPVFNANEDAPKVMDSLPGVPNLYSLTSDNVKCGTNGYSPLTQSAVIGIGVLLDSATQYTFSLQQFSNFDSTTLVILEDRLLNSFTELQVNSYQVLLTPADTSGRFFLHVTSAVHFNTVAAGCANNNGVISVSADTGIIWGNASLIDSTGALITSYSNAQGLFTFNNLAEGTYNITLNYDGYITTKIISVNGFYIVAGFTASSQDVLVGETINFTSSTTNTTGYVWQFGDSTVITGVANPDYFYYAPGVYTVTLICSNADGCTAEVQMTITVSSPTGIITPATKGISIINLGAKTVEVLMNDVPINLAELDVYNILGQAIYTSPVTTNQMLVSLVDQPAGIYLVTVKNGGKNTTTKVYIN